MAKKNKTFKVTAIIIGTIIILGILIYALTGLVLEPYIKDKIRSNVQTFGKVKYKIDFVDMDLQFFAGDIYFNRLKITPFEDPLNITRDNYTLVIEKLSLLGFNFWSLIDQDNYEINQVRMDSCRISIYKYVEETSDTTTDHSKQAAPEIGAISIKNFNINKALLTIYNVGKGVYNPLFHANVNFSADNVYYKYGPKWAKDLQYNNLKGLLTNLEVKSNDSIRRYSINKVQINGDNESHYATADDFNIETRAGKYELADLLGHEGEWISLNIPELNIRDWQVKPMLLDLDFKTSEVNIQNPRLTVFTDKRAPDKTKEHELPYDFIKDWKTRISIDSLNISGGKITYEEHVKAMEEPGYISFTNINAAILNLTNDSVNLKKNGRKAYMNVKADVMDTAPLEVDFVFNLEPNATHTIKGKLGEIQMTAVNPMIAKVGYVKFEKGICHSLEFNYTCTAEKAEGEALFKYEDLEIETISRTDGDEDSFGQEIKSFVADFIVDDDNMGSDFHKGKISYTRRVDKSTINYWWKALLTGLKDSIGLPAKD